MNVHGQARCSPGAAVGSGPLLLPCLERGLGGSFCSRGSTSQFSSCLWKGMFPAIEIPGKCLVLSDLAGKSFWQEKRGGVW